MIQSIFIFVLKSVPTNIKNCTLSLDYFFSSTSFSKRETKKEDLFYKGRSCIFQSQFFLNISPGYNNCFSGISSTQAPFTCKDHYSVPKQLVNLNNMYDQHVPHLVSIIFFSFFFHLYVLLLSKVIFSTNFCLYLSLK